MNRKFWIRLVVTLGLLGFIATQVDLSGIQLGSPVRVAGGVAVAVVLLVVNQGVTALRWSAILGEDAPDLGYLTRLNMVGIFFSTFLPTSVGGDAVRAWAIAREVREPGLGVSSVVLDRVMGLGAMVAYLAIGAVVARQMVTGVVDRIEWAVPGWAPWLLLLLVPAGVVAFRRTRLSTWVRQGLRHLDRFGRSTYAVLWATLLSFAVQGIYVAVWMVLAAAVGFELPPETFLVTVPVVSLGAMLPVTLSGVGVREGLWILLLAQFGMEPATVTAFSLLYFVAFAATGGLGGAIYLWQGIGREAVAAEAS